MLNEIMDLATQARQVLDEIVRRIDPNQIHDDENIFSILLNFGHMTPAEEKKYKEMIQPELTKDVYEISTFLGDILTTGEGWDDEYESDLPSDKDVETNVASKIVYDGQKITENLRKLEMSVATFVRDVRRSIGTRRRFEPEDVNFLFEKLQTVLNYVQRLKVLFEEMRKVAQESLRDLTPPRTTGITSISSVSGPLPKTPIRPEKIETFSESYYRHSSTLRLPIFENFGR